MQLLIHRTTTIADAQKAFSATFPYLKIEFFTRDPSSGHLGLMKFIISEHDQPFGKFVEVKTLERPFEIMDSSTVAAFEEAFYKRFGLSVLVYRKSMDVWLPISRTEDWTLAEQNFKGRESATNGTQMIYEERSTDDAAN